jgi:tRNA G37 N-methylase Trm5
MHRILLPPALAFLGLFAAFSASTVQGQKSVNPQGTNRIRIHVPADAPITDVSLERPARTEAGNATVLALRQEPGKTGKASQQKATDTKDETTNDDRGPDVVYWPTPDNVVDKMLELADVKKGNVVYDLGCGDARILVTAAKKYGVKGFGFDIDPQRIKESLENVTKNKVQDLVSIRKSDIFKLDLKDADVVTLYLLPELNVKLMPQLAKLKPGARIVSHDFAMKGAKPNKVATLQARNHEGEEGEHTVYLWIVPWEKESE